MCGISVLAGKHLNEAVLGCFPAMNGTIKHRGPDDAGGVFFSPTAPPCVFAFQDTPQSAIESDFPYSPKERFRAAANGCCLALGHRRLSILDLSAAGHQPMCTPDKNFWITYNGEVYNYIEIRNELISLGHVFLTHTDTEVILHAWQEWGPACLHRFNGMFAFALFDRIKQKLFAVRDRFGVKPLYQWQSPSGFIALASEIKQFTVLPGWSPVLNGQAAYDFLNWGAKNHAEETFFQGVRQVLPGHYLEIEWKEEACMQSGQWYKPMPVPFRGTFEEAALQFQSLLRSAVQLRLRADVEVGSCLSGGLDSSTIVCLVHEELKSKGLETKQRTFTARSRYKQFDEGEFAENVAIHTNVRAHYSYPSLNDLFSDYEELIWMQDEPLASTSMYAQHCVFKAAKESQVKVILDGQGSDEHLAGYHGFFGNLFYDMLKSLNLKGMINEMRYSQMAHPSLQPLPLLLNKLVPDLIRQPLRSLFGKSSKYAPWLDIKKLGIAAKDPFAGMSNKTVLEQSLQQIQFSSLPMLLHSEDRNSMAHSIESRTPFLDYRLVEFSLGLPPEYKIGNGWTKRILREGMKGILPEKIRLRQDKVGFVTPEQEWVRREGADTFRRLIKESMDSAQGIIKPNVLPMVEEIIAGKRPYTFLIWRLISFGKWCERFNAKTELN